MIEIISRWIIVALSLVLTAYLIPGIEVPSFYVALIVAVLLALVNAIIRPVLILLTLPITIITLGLFTLVINGLLFWMVTLFVNGFEVGGFWTAMIGAFIVSIFSFIGSRFIKKTDE